MKYLNLGDRTELVSLSEAIFKGLANDGSLYMPEVVPALAKDFIEAMPHMSLSEIAFEVLKPYLQSDMDDSALKEMVEQTFSFPIPLRPLEENIAVLELFHGPTQAFKDVGARFLSRLMSYFRPATAQKLVVLTATSGDTGGAVANGFHKVPGIEVVVLYPRGKISPYQQYQIAGPGENIRAIAVEGSFDDCQRMAKQAFNDVALRQQVTISSANSINMGRLLPQMVYYFEGVARMMSLNHGQAPVICVPSGNFGNLTAAVMAFKMGLPVRRFLAATNVNDVVPRFLTSGEYQPKPTIATLANAMDVGDPSNFSRLYALFEKDVAKLKKLLSACPVSDGEIRDTIQSVHQRLNYLLDPHSAIAYTSLKQSLEREESGFFVATAHPRKFVEVIDTVMPEVGKNLREKYGANFVTDKNCITMASEYKLLKDYLLNLT